MSEKNRPGRRLQIAFAIAVLVGAIIMLVAMERAAKPDTEPPPDAPKSGSTATPPSTSAASPSQGVATKPGPAPVVVEPGPTATRAFFASPTTPPPSQERSPLADTLNAPDGSGQRDLTVVAALFTTFRDHFHELPVGSNAEITAALAGDNARGLAVLPADHGAINARGELTDRWGTPLFFHQLGAGVMEIRSAGPDRRMHTADDLVQPPPAAPPADLVP